MSNHSTTVKISEAGTPIDREMLYKEIWSNPVTVVARQYGLSDVGLAKICRNLAIPLPSRGYWAKVKAGKTMKRAPLPPLEKDANPGVALTKIDESKQKAHQAAKQQSKETRAAVQSISVGMDLTSPHPLITAAAKRLKRNDGWSNEKGLRSAPAEVLNLEATRSSLDRALLLLDALVKELTNRSVTIHIDAKAKQTIFMVNEIAVSLTVTEHVKRTAHEDTPTEKKAKERYWNRNHSFSAPDLKFPHTPSHDYHPTGILTITAGRWPSRNWNDTPRTPLENRLGEVVAGIYALAEDIRVKEAKEAQRREEHRRAEERYDFLVQRLNNERTRFKQLEVDAMNLERANRLRSYASAVEQSERFKGTVTSEHLERIAWALAKADWLDPRIEVSDPILDAPEPKNPSYW
jgi:hypothetical protein